MAECRWFGLAILAIIIYTTTCLGEDTGKNVSAFNGSDKILVTTHQDVTKPYQFEISGEELQRIINVKVEPARVLEDAQSRANSEGPKTIKQVSNIYDNLTNNWMYTSDMREGEDNGDYFQFANHSISLAKNGWTGGGDCDDYAILMASMLEAIGMTTRIILAYGPKESHAYPEVYLGSDTENREDIKKIKKWIQIRYNLKSLADINTHENISNHEVWLNLDWGEKPYRSAKRNPGFKFFIGQTANLVIYAKPSSPKTRPVPVPMALFTVQPSGKINVTDTVEFNASKCEEVDTIKEYSWTFGDGKTFSGTQGEAAIIKHQFKSSGLFKVSLQVTDEKGLLIQNTTEIEVIGGPLQLNRPRITLFEATPEAIYPDETVRLEWKVENATKVTIDPGNKEVPPEGILQEKLNETTIYTMKAVKDPEGLGDVKNIRVLVVKRPPPPPNRPAAIIICNTSKPKENESVKFEGSRSTGKIRYYEWNLGDGTIIANKTVEHPYAQPGTYQVTLLVIDENNVREYSAPYSLTVYPSNPTALFSVKAKELNVGKPIIFDASPSRGSSGETDLIFDWDFGDKKKGNKSNETHIFENSAKYPVRLTVTDRKGLNVTKTETVSIEEVPPEPLFSTYPDKPQAGSPVRFDASASIPGRRKIISYKWDFGDKKPGETGIMANRTFQQGNYLVKLTLTDEGKITANKSQWLMVSQEEIPEATDVLSVKSFTFTPNPVCSGDTTKISWKTTGATGVTITPGIGIVEPSGFRILSPKETMGYTIRAWNSTTNTKLMTVLLRVEQCIEPSAPGQDKTASVVYDFLEEAHDQGQWQSGPPDVIFHFGERSESDNRGSAMWKRDAQLNDMSWQERVLQVNPPEKGYVSGTYRHMNYKVQAGDHITGRVAFFKEPERGNVTFSLFLIDGNTYHLLWSRQLSWQEGSAGFDVPLGNYAGWKPAICLSVETCGQSWQEKAVWQDVKILGSPRIIANPEKIVTPKDYEATIFENWDTRRSSSLDRESESSAENWLRS